LVLYSVVYFSFDNALVILKNTIITSFFTFIMVYLTMGILINKND